MNRKIILVIGLILLILGLAIVGFLKAIPAPRDQTTSLPKIEITPAEYDFGDIDFGEIVKYSFKVKNLGNQVLEIKRVATSCACTTAKISKDKINPSEEADLLVTYDTAAMGRSSHGMGKQERIIYVKNNDPVKPQAEVMIYANVK